MMVASSMMTTLEAVFLRQLSNEASQAQVLLFRAGMQLVLVAIVGTFLTGSFGAVIRTSRLRVHIGRGALAAFSWWSYFMSFKALPLALATTLTFSSQLFVLLLVWPMLRERVTRPQLVTTLIGFTGVLIAAGIWNPMTLDWRVVYGLSASLVGAVMIVMTRSLSFTERNETILFYMALAVFLSAIPQCMFSWVPLHTGSLVLLLLLAFCGTLGAWLMVAAYRNAEPSAMAPYIYVRLVFAAVVGYVVFADTIAWTTVAGAALIVASNLALALYVGREKKAAAHK